MFTLLNVRRFITFTAWDPWTLAYATVCYWINKIMDMCFINMASQCLELTRTSKSTFVIQWTYDLSRYSRFTRMKWIYSFFFISNTYISIIKNERIWRWCSLIVHSGTMKLLAKLPDTTSAVCYPDITTPQHISCYSSSYGYTHVI